MGKKKKKAKKKKKKKKKKAKKKKKKKKKKKVVKYPGGKRPKGVHKSKASIAAGKKIAAAQKKKGIGLFGTMTPDAKLKKVLPSNSLSMFKMAGMLKKHIK